MISALLDRISGEPDMSKPVSSKDGHALIREGRAPAGLQVTGCLKLQNCAGLTFLPEGLRADGLDVSGCKRLQSLPKGLLARRINVSGCHALTHLPDGLRCYELDASNSGLHELPDDFRVDFRLDLSRCEHLERLPNGLKVGSLLLRDCTNLEALPEDLNVSFLDISGCLGMHHWPRRAAVQVGRFVARGCMQLTALPDWLQDIAQLDLSGCANITEIPPHLRVRSWADIANTGITSLPDSWDGVQLRWRGVAIDRRVALEPQSITTQEILAAANVELRRVLMERMGYETFMQEVKAQPLDRDMDAGGERRLLRVPMEGDEPLVCLSVLCPSTGRQYMLRVPPTTRTCRQAAAWLAGFDNADDYRPVAET